MQELIDLKRIAALVSADPVAASQFTEIRVSDDDATFVLPIMGATVAIRVRPAICWLPGRVFDVGVVGLSNVGRRWVHDVMGFCARFSVASQSEFAAVYERVPLESTAKFVFRGAEMASRFRHQEESASFSPSTTCVMFWGAGVLNFGDWIGPLLVSRLTGRQPVLQNRAGLQGRRSLWSVGSILGWFKRDNVDVWGSGLIKTSD